MALVEQLWYVVLSQEFSWVKDQYKYYIDPDWVKACMKAYWPWNIDLYSK